MRMQQFLDLTTPMRRHVVCALTLMLCVDATARAQVSAPRTLNAAEAQRLADFLSVPLRIAVAASLRKHAHAVRARVRELVS